MCERERKREGVREGERVCVLLIAPQKMDSHITLFLHPNDEQIQQIRARDSLYLKTRFQADQYENPDHSRAPTHLCALDTSRINKFQDLKCSYDSCQKDNLRHTTPTHSST